MFDLPWLTAVYEWFAQFFSSDFLEFLLKNYGYYAIIGLTFLEGETIVIIAGMFAAGGLLDPWLIALCAFLGSCSSDQLMFSLGKYKGQAMLERFPKLAQRLDKASVLFKKYDTMLILGFRFVYGVRNVTPIMLGISGVSHRKFLALNIVGAIIWSASFTAGGFFFGKLFEHIMGNIGFALLCLLALLLLGVLLWLWRKNRQNRSGA